MKIEIFIFLIFLAIIVVYVFAKYYFHLNKKLLSKNNKSFIDENNLHIVGDDTITESNNTLSKKPFDGINRNANNQIKYNENNEHDIAHESCLTQGQKE